MPKRKDYQLEQLQEKLEETEREVTRLQQEKVATEKSTVRSSFLLRERKLRTFSGRKEEDLDNWIEDVERAVSRRESIEEKMDFLMEHLAGDALQEVRHRCRLDINNIEDIFQVLRATFGTGNKTHATLERQFYNRKQARGESLRQYSHALMTLARPLNKDKRDTNSMLVEQFSENVRNPALKRELKLLSRQENLTFMELRDDAIAWAGEDSSSEEEGNSVGVEHIKRNVQDPVEDIRLLASKSLSLTETLLERVKKLEEASQSTSKPLLSPQPQQLPQPPRQRPDRSKLICYRCNKVGHIARECRSNQTGQTYGVPPTSWAPLYWPPTPQPLQQQPPVPDMQYLQSAPSSYYEAPTRSFAPPRPTGSTSRADPQSSALVLARTSSSSSHAPAQENSLPPQ